MYLVSVKVFHTRNCRNIFQKRMSTFVNTLLTQYSMKIDKEMTKILWKKTSTRKTCYLLSLN